MLLELCPSLYHLVAHEFGACELMQWRTHAYWAHERSPRQAEIRKAYKQRALKLHPDKNPDKPDAATIFHRLVKAYDLLSDEKAKEA